MNREHFLNFVAGLIIVAGVLSLLAVVTLLLLATWRALL